MARRNGWWWVAPVAIVGWRLWARRARSLAGNVALITGGSRGLGLEIARELAARGCGVAICGRDEDTLRRAADALVAEGADDVLAVRCDVADRADVAAAVERVLARFGRLDLVVNNASIIQVGPLEAMTLEDFENALAVNFWGTVHTTLAVLPHMRARRTGRIVNVTSIGGKVAIPHLLPYACAKFAAVGFSEGLRAELAKDGVTVTTVVPGLMRTGSPAHALFKGDAAREYAWFTAGDLTPATSMSARRAAQRIVEAAARGEAEVTLSWQAKVLRLAHALMPGVTADLLGGVNRLLPRASSPTVAVEGRAVAPASPRWMQRVLSRLTFRYNQRPAT